jgi:hypothetical protein
MVVFRKLTAEKRVAAIVVGLDVAGFPGTSPGAPALQIAPGATVTFSGQFDVPRRVGTIAISHDRLSAKRNEPLEWSGIPFILPVVDRTFDRPVEPTTSKRDIGLYVFRWQDMTRYSEAARR